MKTAAKNKPGGGTGGVKRTARGFDGGKSGRRLRAIPTNSAAINSQIRTYGKQLLARSRYLALNNPYAMAAREEYVSALVGCGIKPSPLTPNANQKKEFLELWRDWTDEADADGLTDFYGLQAIIAGEMFEAGECFVRIRPRFASDGLTVPMQLQLLPAEMLQTDYNETLTNGGRIECGIEFDAIGKRVAYHFLRVHPGEMLAAVAVAKSERVRVPATEVLHLFKPLRAGQIRGIPHTVAGIVTLAMLDLYDDAELERKRIAALFGAFVERTGGDDEAHPFGGAEAESDTDLQETRDSDWSLEPGAVIDLLPGQKVTFAEPADVGGNYEAFEYRMLLRSAAGFGGTYAGMTGDLRGTSYSSIRAGLVQFRRKIEQQQHAVMVFQFCRCHRRVDHGQGQRVRGEPARRWPREVDHPEVGMGGPAQGSSGRKACGGLGLQVAVRRYRGRRVRSRRDGRAHCGRSGTGRRPWDQVRRRVFWPCLRADCGRARGRRGHDPVRTAGR
jgi:lambda family phage portal protein